MSERISCGDCRYFRPTGTQDSGLTLPQSREPWRYVVGDCTRPTEALGAPDMGSQQPEWSSCYMAKRSRRAAPPPVGEPSEAGG